VPSDSSEISLNAGTSPAAASTVVTTGVNGLSRMGELTIFAKVTGATGGTLDIYIQDSPDGVIWYDYWHIPQIVAGAAAVRYAYCPAMNDSVTVIGAVDAGTSPLLANGQVRGGKWHDRMRVIYVAGTGTSAGAVQDIRLLASY
jgi:hypothetical protein